ncbi:DUF350 domain-containing protein [Exiguobacterium algae]|uniref:DUF350 domain-containing protein n=1 Tax=Exiguobacterium algae TaxID=2751250 RepID=UPI001BECA145|nr:DUF350 domain-containing protein [Exiguobacterium algae]
MTLITLDSILSFLAHLGTGFGLVLAGLIIFALTTKYSERQLIKEGNLPVALKLWGKALGLAIVIYTVWANSINLLDAFIWGIVGIIAQVLAFWVFEYILTPGVNLEKEVENGNMAIGFSLFSASIVVGIIVAASLTY